VRKDILDIFFRDTSKGDLVPQGLVNHVPRALEQMSAQVNFILGQSLPVRPQPLLHQFDRSFDPFFTVDMVQPPSHLSPRHIRHSCSLSTPVFGGDEESRSIPITFVEEWSVQSG
jgi:hypothetical protein